MNKLTLEDMFKAIKVELYEDLIYKNMEKIDPSIREELIRYLIKNRYVNEVSKHKKS